MGNNTSKKNTAVEAKEIAEQEDLRCQSYSRLQESEKLQQKTDAKCDKQNGDDKIETVQKPEVVCADDNGKKSSKVDKKKKDKSKKRKRSDRSSLVDSNAEGVHEDDSVAVSVTSKSDDTEIPKSPNETHAENWKTDTNSNDEDDYKTKQIIDNVVNETRVLDGNSISAVNSDPLVDEITKDSFKSVSEEIADTKNADSPELEQKSSSKKKSKKNKKIICKKEKTRVDDDTEKDDTSEKYSKKKKGKKDKKLTTDDSEVSKIDESIDCSHQTVNPNDTEDKKTSDLKEHKKDKAKSKDDKKHKQDKSTDSKKEKAAKVKDNKLDKIKSKDSKKKSKKEDKKKNKSKDELKSSEEMPLTLSDDAPIMADEVEVIEVNVIVGNDTESEQNAVLEHSNTNEPAQSDDTSKQGENANGISGDGIVISNESDDNGIQDETVALIAGSDENPPHDKQGITTDAIETVIIENQISIENPKSEKSRSVKARKDSANKKKKVKSQKNSYDVTEFSTSDQETEVKKMSKKDSKKKLKSQTKTNDVTEVSTSDQEAEHKKMTKKESKKKVDSSVSSKKLSKKEKKSSKKIKQPQVEGRRLLDSESSIGCRSQEFENPLERTRPQLILDDFDIPEHLHMDGISLSSVSLDGEEDVFSSSKHSIIDHSIVPATSNTTDDLKTGETASSTSSVTENHTFAIVKL
ncbi:hypothetical protein ScPMuIL_012246 [Solemya velum]